MDIKLQVVVANVVEESGSFGLEWDDLYLMIEFLQSILPLG